MAAELLPSSGPLAQTASSSSKLSTHTTETATLLSLPGLLASDVDSHGVGCEEPVFLSSTLLHTMPVGCAAQVYPKGWRNR